MDTEPKQELLRAVLRERGLSNSELKQAASRGKVRLRGVPTADLGRPVWPEDVAVVPDAPRVTPGRDLAVLYRDHHLAVVWTPSGLLSVRASGRGSEPDLVSSVGRIFGQSYPVHRLDEETSGVMMVALNERTQFEIKRLLEHHDVERRYLALVRGYPTEERWSMDTQLVRDRGDGKRGTGEGEDSKSAFTQFELIQKLEGGVSLVEATLETGRTHQVRIHLAESGLPVLGDKLYGDKGSARKAPRVALHAAVLGFEHPMTHEELYFDIPLADDLEQLRRSFLVKPEEAPAAQGRSGKPQGGDPRASARAPKKKKRRAKTKDKGKKKKKKKA